MPLVVPGINNASGTELQNWQTKLLGKTLGGEHSETAFKQADLPKDSRVLTPDNQVMTMDHKPDRLNVHLNDKGLIEKVTYG